MKATSAARLLTTCCFGGVLAASCGGKTTTVTTADGGMVTFERGAFCKNLDLSTYLTNVARPPKCDPENPPASMFGTTKSAPTRLTGGLTGVSYNPTCMQWATGFKLPIVPETICVTEGALRGTCALDGYISVDDHNADCLYTQTVTPNDPPAVVGAEKFCASFFSQAVLGDGSVAGNCYQFPVEWSQPMNAKYTRAKCVDRISGYDWCDTCPVFDISTNPPTPSVCVKRKETWVCEKWCQQQ